MSAAGERVATGRNRWRWGLVIGILGLLILGPFVLWGHQVEGWVDTFIRSEPAPAAAAAVLGGLLAADVLLPIPSSVVLVAAGAFLGTALGSVVCAAGMSLGCLVAAVLGRALGRPGLRRLVDPVDLARFDALAARFGTGTLILLRPVPVLAEASVLLAGAAAMAWPRFVLATTGANLVIAGVYAAVGDFAARSGRPELAVAAALGLPALAMLAARRRAGRNTDTGNISDPHDTT